MLCGSRVKGKYILELSGSLNTGAKIVLTVVYFLGVYMFVSMCVYVCVRRVSRNIRASKGIRQYCPPIPILAHAQEPPISKGAGCVRVVVQEVLLLLRRVNFV